MIVRQESGFGVVLDDEIVHFYCECVAGELLASICTTDAIFDSLSHELAGHLGIRVSEASALLWPTHQRIYQAAKAASYG